MATWEECNQTIEKIVPPSGGSDKEDGIAGKVEYIDFLTNDGGQTYTTSTGHNDVKDMLERGSQIYVRLTVDMGSEQIVEFIAPASVFESYYNNNYTISGIISFNIGSGTNNMNYFSIYDDGTNLTFRRNTKNL